MGWMDGWMDAADGDGLCVDACAVFVVGRVWSTATRTPQTHKNTESEEIGMKARALAQKYTNAKWCVFVWSNIN